MTDVDEDEGKTCPKCGEFQTLNNFYYREDRKVYSSWCIQCQRDASHDKYIKGIGRKVENPYWMIPEHPGHFKTTEDQENVRKFLTGIGWKYNNIYHCWLKKGMKEIVNGEIKWLKIFRSEKTKNKRHITGKNKKELLKLSMKYRTVERPDYETLKRQITELGYRGTGRLYGKSDNGVRKWLRFYEKLYNIR
jgi:hypothetical protein